MVESFSAHFICGNFLLGLSELSSRIKSRFCRSIEVVKLNSFILIESNTSPLTSSKFTNLPTKPLPSAFVQDTSPSPCNNQPFSPSDTTQDLKPNSKNRMKKKNLVKSIKRSSNKPRKSAPQQESSQEEIIEYQADEYFLSEEY
ncbi:hypothetical protein TNCT_30411 [Trichonephila clavata]|uniref:Uncharacterized protein n=1 Tax=Trichonephila clavata TaxID=2740835 RepID=A0A8X6LF90_TRICU|nr:hypothetical protein TNCT_30411 [Trichonephila clavata]